MSSALAALDFARDDEQHAAMITRATASAFVLALALVAGSTHARESTDAPAVARFGARSRVVVSVENVLGGYSEDLSDSAGAEGANSLNVNGFFPGFTGPRLAVNAFVFENVTVGSGFGLWWLKDTTSKAQSTTARVVRIAPRVGWTPTFGKLFSFWLRAGVTYLGLEPGGFQFFDVSGEAFLVYAPMPHFGVLLGPSADLPISGKSSTTSGLRFQSIGVAAGLFVDF